MTSYLHSSIVALGAAALLLVLYPIGTIIYNLFFHPLRNFPGPIYARASKLPWCIYRARGRQTQWTHKMHEKYGEVVRLAPDQLSFIGVEAWRDIYGHKIGNRGGFSKDLRFYGPDSAGANGIIRTNDEDHARHRRLLAHAFSDKALREQEPLIRKYVDMLIEKLDDVAQTKQSVDAVRMYNYATFDIMGDLAFGEPLGLLEQSDYSPWVSAIFGTIKMGVLLSLLNSEFPLLASFVKRFMLPKSLTAKRAAHKEYSEQRVNVRLARETDRPDIWTFVLRHQGKDESLGLRLEEMHATGSTLMIAGTETTATLLSGLTFHLLRNPSRLARLKAEVRQAFQSPDDMSMAALAQLPYLDACVHEGLRIYPPVPVGLPRITPPEGRVVCGKAVPPGACCALSHYAAYHSSQNFCDPDAFVPERWLPDREPKYEGDQRAVVEPFSYGPRNCIGKNLAYHEMRLILANVMWHFDLELCPGSEGWDDQKVYTIWEKNPLHVTLTPVKQG